MAHMQRKEVQRCIDACGTCHDICVETSRHCLEMGGRHAAAAHMTLLLDCAEICQTSADFMLRGSAFQSRLCAECAEICDRCAEECEALGGEELKRCAQACRECARACREMAGAASAR